MTSIYLNPTGETWHLCLHLIHALLDGAGPSTVLDGAGPSTVLDGAGPSTVLDGAGPTTVLDGAGPSTVLDGAGSSTVHTCNLQSPNPPATPEP